MIKLFCSAMAIFLLMLSAQAIDVKVAPNIVPQGKCFSIIINNSGKSIKQVGIIFLGQVINGYQTGDDYVAIVGIPCEQKPGNYFCSIIITKEDGKREETQQIISIKKSKFPFVSFWLKPAKKKLLNKDLINDEWAQVEKTLISESQERKWEGLFTLPVKGPVSMHFGTVERVNGQKGGKHRGLDLAVMSGTKVFAPATGRVVFARQLKAFGGTVVIDHGLGINSLYFHLSKIFAEVGQIVDKGEELALSGNTGVSSGPHLHWGLSVHNLRVDPLQWTKTIIL